MNPFVPIVLTGAALTAIIAAFSRKKGPTPGPIDAAPLLMAGGAGTRQYEIRKVGPGFAWYVKGDREGAGSDTKSSQAILDMFEFLYTGNNTDIITGYVAKSASEEGLAGSFTITQQGSKQTDLQAALAIWDWIVSKPAPDQSSSLGSGSDANRGSATINALKVLAPLTDWLSGLPDLQGDPGAPDPTAPDPIEPTTFELNHYQLHGLDVSKTTVAAFDLPQWIEYAYPIIEANFGASPADLHELLGLSVLADTRKFTGKTEAQVLAAMQKYLDQWTSNKYLELDPIQTALAAAAVGAKLSTIGKKGYVKGKPVIVVKTPTRYRWLVWPPGNRRSEQYALFQGEAMLPAKAWNEAVNAAAGPGTVQGGGAPIQSCDEGVKIVSLSRNSPSTSFEESWDKEIKLWEPGSVECRHYTVDIGVCLVPTGGGSFGALDYYLTDVGEGEVPTKGDADEVTFGIDRHPAYNAPMDWYLFKTPIVWKRQYRIEVSYIDGVLQIQNTQQQTIPDVDPCPEKTRRWPGLGDDHYVVQKWRKVQGQAPTLSTVNWTSQPALSLFVEGKNLFANVNYRGLPSFKTYAGEPSVVKVQGADPAKKNSYTIGFKIRSTAE